MRKHYLKIALRNLSRQKLLSLINIIGLSIGLACFSLFLLYAVNEFSFDRFHKNSENIYRVYEWTEGLKGSEPSGDAWLYMPLGPAMKKDLPGIENYVRYENGNDQFIRAGNNVLKMGISYADPQIFDVFSFKLLYGNPSNALKNQRDVVLTRAKAIQLFGSTNIVGKSLEIKIGDKFEPFVVSAVAENTSANSSIQFNVLLSFDYLQTQTFEKNAVNNWHFTGYINFVLLQNGTSLKNGENVLAKFREKYFPDEKTQLIKSGEWDGKGPYPISFRLQPLRDIHTNTLISAGSQRGIDTKYIWILLSIAAGLLFIACVNFTTLSIGRSAGRAKEVGLRKTIGGSRKGLILQFLSEALLMSILSGLIALLLIQLLLPYFNHLSEKELVFSFAQYPELIGLFAGLVILTGILAGIYPAFVLSGFKPITALRNKVRLGGSNIFTKSLVTIQFVLSIGLIISTIIILQELSYMRSRNPGFNKENVVVINAAGSDISKVYPLFKEQMRDYNQVSSVSGSDAPFGNGYNQSGFDFGGKHEQAFHFATDADFMKTMGMQLVSGRNFDPFIAADSTSAAIVNEALVNDLGLSDDKILGLKLSGYGGKKDPVVIGVVRNFNFRSLKEKISAILFRESPRFIPSVFFVRIKPGNPSESLERMKKTWKSLAPDIPFQYSFLDDDLDQIYKTETKWSGIVGWAGGISIFLACLGLFGLASLSAFNRTKEIGIRKVLGATALSIVRLLSGEFLMLVFIAFVIAATFAWYFMNKWLQDYAYRIDLKWWVFALTGGIALVIAFGTVTAQVLKTALASPVKSLTNE